MQQKEQITHWTETILSLFKQTGKDIIIKEMVVPLVPRCQRTLGPYSTLSELIDWSTLRNPQTLNFNRTASQHNSPVAQSSTKVQPENCWEILKAGGSLEDRIVYTTYKPNLYGFISVDSSQHPSSRIRPSSSKMYQYLFIVIPDISIVTVILLLTANKLISISPCCVSLVSPLNFESMWESIFTPKQVKTQKILHPMTTPLSMSSHLNKSELVGIVILIGHMNLKHHQP